MKKLCEEYWDFVLQTSPTWATFLGDRRYDSELPRLDAASRRSQQIAVEDFLSRLARLDRSALPEGDRVTADVLQHELEKRRDEEKLGFHEWNIDQMDGLQVSLLELPNYHPVDAVGWRSLVSRLEKVPRCMREYLANLREGLQKGNVAPQVAVDRVAEQLRKIIAVPTEKFPLMDAVGKMTAELRAREGAAFREALQKVVEQEVRPALQEYLLFLEREYAGKGRKAVGLGWNEAGQRAYEHRIWFHTSLRLSAKELHRVGRETLAEVQASMREIQQRLGIPGTLRDLNEKLRKDPSQGYSERAGLVRDAERLVAKAGGVLPRLFGRLPKDPCIVKAIEEFREKDAPAAYYYGPPEDGSRPGIYYINTYDPGSRVKYTMAALAYHEAVPGHHFQIALARELTDLPKFRRHSGVTAFIEGWALYAELLADETGLYENDYERYGMLTYQALRASRLVVDTGIHALGWTREQAIDFFRENVAISEGEIENEIDRYIIWPGQALAYMVGRCEIQALRKKAEQALGAKFDLRSFHDEILRNGAIPLSVLRNVMDRWMERRAAD